MSWQATEWARGQVCGKAAGKCLLYAIANYADEHGRCWPSQARLAADTEMDVRSVRRWIDKFSDLNIVAVVPRRGPKGHRASDEIRLRMGDSEGEETQATLPDKLTGRDEDENPDIPSDEGQSQPVNLSVRHPTGQNVHSNRTRTSSQPDKTAPHIRINTQEPPKEHSPQPPGGGLSSNSGFGQFKTAWADPSANWQRAEAVWAKLDDGLRADVLLAVPGFRRQATANRDKWAPSTFLKKPDLIKIHAEAARAEAAIVRLRPHSAAWWAHFWALRGGGDHRGVAEMVASSNRACETVVPLADAPTETELHLVKPYRADGPGWSTWKRVMERGHEPGAGLETRGDWIYLSAEYPPGFDASTALVEVRLPFTSAEVAWLFFDALPLDPGDSVRDAEMMLRIARVTDAWKLWSDQVPSPAQIAGMVFIKPGTAEFAALQAYLDSTYSLAAPTFGNDGVWVAPGWLGAAEEPPRGAVVGTGSDRDVRRTANG